jgi:N-acetyl-anhydromuramyl-L-alanine amidase AmpD
MTDKWISASPGQGQLFFNILGNGIDSKCGGFNAGDKGVLAAHFQYVNRVMGDIGNDAVIDITKLNQLKDNIKITLYQYISDLLTENEYMFYPLPAYINLAAKGLQENDLLDMFRPSLNFEKVSCGPLFLSMYVGGNSRQLSFKAASNCSADITPNFDNDSFNLSIEGIEKPDEFLGTSTNNSTPGFTAFKVVYGLENQNHFKNIQLDQTEFSETAESLLVVDKLAQQGGTDQSTKGQNLNSVYLTRSYTCTMESLGNMMIQPMMYFDLFGVPMFNGAYLITEVKHNFKPNHATTTFKGTRQPIATIPIVTDAAVAMTLTLKDIKASTNANSISAIGGGGVGAGSGPLLAGIKETTIKLPSGADAKLSQLNPLLDVTYNQNRSFKNGNPEWIVLHWAGGFNFEGEIAALKKNKLAYHLTIDTDGSIKQLYNLDKVSSHAGCEGKTVNCKSFNSPSIGISYIGGVENGDKYGYQRTWSEWQTEDLNYNQLGKCQGDGVYKDGCIKTTYKSKKQWESIINAILIAKAHHPSIKGITSHHLLSGEKSDVGDNFPWTELFKSIKEKSGWEPVFGNEFRDDKGQLIKKFKNDTFISYAQDIVEYQQSSGFGQENFTIKQIYDYLNNKIQNQNLVFGIMGNIKQESQFQNYATGDGPKPNGTGLPAQNGSWYCSWGFTQLNVCGGIGNEFLKENNLENANNSEKIRALTNPTKHLDYVIKWVEKNYGNGTLPVTQQDTVENWAKRFADDYENCTGCSTSNSPQQLTRAKNAVSLSNQTWT